MSGIKRRNLMKAAVTGGIALSAAGIPSRLVANIWTIADAMFECQYPESLHKNA